MLIPGFEIVNPDAKPVKRVVFDLDLLDVARLESPSVPEGADASMWRDIHVVWYVADKMRKAGIPVTPLTGQLMHGVITYYDLHDAPVRRYVWEETC